jgi:hypothetical protein
MSGKPPCKFFLQGKYPLRGIYDGNILTLYSQDLAKRAANVLSHM